jgi:hypothetical protein
MGREDLAVYDVPVRIAKKACKPLLRDGKPVDPVAYIAEAARAAPITMISEGHGEPMTRYFNQQVATALRPLGYGAYAAETFSKDIGETGPAIPLYEDGFYSREPIYGRLIRKLRELGFRFVPYEADIPTLEKYPPIEREGPRRAEQAANLAARMKQQSAKLLVHAGMGNHSEYVLPDRLKNTGARFTEMTGLDPLTIEALAFEAPAATPVVCDPAEFADRPHTFDIHVALPKVTFQRGRPAWRLSAGDHFAEVPEALRRADQIAVYEARSAGERTDSTPMERLLLRPGENLPLLLPPGRYDLSVWTEKDGWSQSVLLTVR